MRAAVYARFSSEEQTGGESIEFQLERCQEFITAQGWSLSDENVFIDRARSGTSTHRRDGFNRMISLADVAAPPFDYVIVYSTSRFSRDMTESALFKAMLRRRGVSVRSVTEPIRRLHRPYSGAQVFLYPRCICKA